MPLFPIRNLPAIDELREEWKKDHLEDRIIENPSRIDFQNVKHISILNLMPVKERTERQLLRRLAMSECPVRVSFWMTETYRPTHTDPEHLKQFYTTFSAGKEDRPDGLIITGAPVEFMQFEDVTYFDELCRIMDWAREEGIPVLFICWGAQAGLYHHYGIQKFVLPAKQFGIFEHQLAEETRLTEGMHSPFYAPHSRHTFTREDDVAKVPDLRIAARSEKAGVYLMVDEKHQEVYVTGHSEYEADTLSFEYFRDINKGLKIDVPEHYFPEDDPARTPVSIWRAHSEELFRNWVDRYVCREEKQG